jgi:hypothetical protein
MMPAANFGSVGRAQNRPRFAQSGIAFFVLLTCLAGAADAPSCIPFEQATKHLGQKHCVSGRVLHVEQTAGATFLDFCADYRTCTFTVVAFNSDLSLLGDLSVLSGQVVQIEGKIEEYDGRAEILLENQRQLLGAAGKLPALPRQYDVSQRGHASPGSYALPRSKRRPTRKRQPDLSAEDPTMPE